MRIGILTYHCVPNFGAQLQATSTVGYLKRMGHEPIVLNWYPKDLEDMYANRVPKEQIEAHNAYTNKYLPITSICRTEEDLVNVIEQNNIDAIIVGSDALFKYVPEKNRRWFSKRKLRFIERKIMSCELFDGNPFLGGFIAKLNKKVPTVAFSVSSENCDYKAMKAHERVAIKSAMDNFSHISSRVGQLGITSLGGELLDLGVSSYQIDEPERGFSYMAVDAPLDMRMDREQQTTAADILNTYSEAELFRVIRDYGEEKFAKNIAKNIVKERSTKPFETVGQLNEIIDMSIPAKIRKAGGHPAKKTFQALRIELNRELEVLSEHIDEWIDLLAPGGRLCIITFHSLEDRIVKQAFKKNEDPCTCPKDFPVCVCGKKSKGKVITRKPILPSEEEMEENPRSRSAKLRVFERA